MDTHSVYGYVSVSRAAMATHSVYEYGSMDTSTDITIYGYGSMDRVLISRYTGTAQ